ncbi:choice-of-anchor Q domain-containing protein [Fibrella sp. WM1]|uniref:choice-of-anchor Q domain-containing protein n=1 Tax=Fibrella musci TaxID=3242485 RepID=UPI0035208645
MRFLLLNCFLFFCLLANAQSIIYVTETGGGDGSGTSWANALPGTLLANRLPAAAAGTQFWIAAGTYKPTTTLDRSASFSIASGVSLYGGFAGIESTPDARTPTTYETVLSGDIGIPNDATDNSKQVIQVRDVNGAVRFDQLTIRRGSVFFFDDVHSGAGLDIYSAAVTTTIQVTNCQFIDNMILPSLSGGGAIAFQANNGAICQLRIEGSVFQGSTAGYGGAVSLVTQGGTLATYISNTTFERNVAQEGGAVSARYLERATGNQVSITRCQFIGNQAYFLAGALVTGTQPIEISQCQFIGNNVIYTSPSGGGGAIDASSCTLAQYRDCLFSGNTAYRGGAVYSTSIAKWTEQVFINCTFTNNAASVVGGAFYNDQFGQARPGSTFPNATITRLTNCILWGNTAPTSPAYHAVYGSEYSNRPLTNYSLIQGYDPVIYIGANNLARDPVFINAQSSNYRLSTNSPAINAGDPATAMYLTTTDLDGNPRLRGGRVDMGAYEFDCGSSGCYTGGNDTVESVQSGGWNQPYTWTCNCIPDSTRSIHILDAHTVTVPDAYTGQAKSIKLIGSGNMQLQGTGKIRLGN